MHKQNLHQGTPPFAEEIDVNHFFPGAGRSRILGDLYNAVVGSVSFITITADEGSGKTTLCKILEKKLPAHIMCVFLPARIESFEDVLKILVQEAGVVFSKEEVEATLQERLEIVKVRLTESGLKVLVIFDEAESLYLATLERSRKMLDHIDSDDLTFTILLSGRVTLHENLKQLSMCKFDSEKEKHFDLPALDSDETFEYLNYSVNKVSDPDVKDVFTREASDKLYGLAQGNFRMTNILAEEALNSVNTDTSFMVLLDNVREKGETPKPKRRLNIKTSWLKDKRNLQVGGAIVCVLLLLLVMIFPSSDNSTTIVDEATINEPSVNAVKTKVNPLKVVPVKKDNVVEMKEEGSKENKAVIAATNQKASEIEAVVIKPKPKSQAKEREKTHAPEVVQKYSVTQEEPGNIQVNSTVFVEQSAKVKKGADLYNERVVAGVRWLNGVSIDKYTVQLMVLTSDTAEENLQKMLVDDDFEDVVNDMYILHKDEVEALSPILVFYGEYPTMAAARNARNSLPQFLRKHHPYAISVKGAVQKVK